MLIITRTCLIDEKDNDQASSKDRPTLEEIMGVDSSNESYAHIRNVTISFYVIKQSLSVWSFEHDFFTALGIVTPLGCGVEELETDVDLVEEKDEDHALW
ncbi:hypothetical protein Tco_0682396 [Tanacetum coccineum]|uniref:Uncharacterized protein n=1 Tax=Tanacetum coccineum TaxID=301880 RepID=A0ABQ4XSK2_9ASTR